MSPDLQVTELSGEELILNEKSESVTKRKW